VLLQYYDSVLATNLSLISVPVLTNQKRRLDNIT